MSYDSDFKMVFLFCDVIISSHNLLSLQRGTDQCDNVGQETERGPQWFNGQGHCG